MSQPRPQCRADFASGECHAKSHATAQRGGGAMLLASGIALAQQLSVDINKVSEAGVGEKIGTVTITEGKQGTTFKVAVSGIPGGKHGFHVHEKGDCGATTKNGKMEAAGTA